MDQRKIVLRKDDKNSKLQGYEIMFIGNHKQKKMYIIQVRKQNYSPLKTLNHRIENGLSCMQQVFSNLTKNTI